MKFPLASSLLFACVIMVRNLGEIRFPIAAVVGHVPAGSDGEVVEGSGIEVIIHLEICWEEVSGERWLSMASG